MTATPVPLPIVDTGPEALFGVTDVHLDDGVVHGRMTTGPWLIGPDAEPTGSAPGGALGVLVDNVLGYAIIASRPPQHWSVSTEISLDLLRPLPWAGEVVATGRVVHADRLGGFSLGEVHDAEGHLVAVARQRGRYVPHGGDPEPLRVDVPRGATDVAGLIGLRRSSTGHELDVVPLLQNPMHNLHGGITIAAADLAAVHCLDDGGPPLVTASVHVVYTRAVPGGTRLDLGTEVRHRGRTLATVDVVGRVAGRVSVVARVTAQPAV